MPTERNPGLPQPWSIWTITCVKRVTSAPLNWAKIILGISSSSILNPTKVEQEDLSKTVRKIRREQAQFPLLAITIIRQKSSNVYEIICWLLSLFNYLSSLAYILWLYSSQNEKGGSAWRKASLRRANCLCPTRGRGGNSGRRDLSQIRGEWTNLLPLEKEIYGMGIAELRRFKQLDEENRKLKQLVADLSLDKHMLQKVIRKKCKAGLATSPCAISVCRLQVSERRACQAIGIHRSSYRYASTAQDQTALRMRLRDLAAARVRYGYRRLRVLLKREGWFVNHKRVYRLYRQAGLSLRLKTDKKRISAIRVLLPVPTAPNQCWRMDFMSDSLDVESSNLCLTIALLLLNLPKSQTSFKCQQNLKNWP